MGEQAEDLTGHGECGHHARESRRQGVVQLGLEISTIFDTTYFCVTSITDEPRRQGVRGTAWVRNN